MSDTDQPQIETDGRLLGTAEHPVVIVERTFEATPDEVWAAWTRPDQLLRWLGAVDGSLDRPSARVTVAMAAEELPPDPGSAENPAVFEVRSARPPVGTVPGELVLGFEDQADPAGTVVVTMAASGDTHCHVVLRHSLSAGNRQGPGFGAGWEGFLAGLSEALAGRKYGEDVLYEAVLPSWERLGQRLERTAPGRMEGDGDQRSVVHHRSIAAAPQAICDLITSADGLSRWLGRVIEGELAAGGTVRIEHDPGADSTQPESIQTSTVQVWEPPTRLELSWDFADEPSSHLRIELVPAGAFTDVV